MVSTSTIHMRNLEKQIEEYVDLKIRGLKCLLDLTSLAPQMISWTTLSQILGRHYKPLQLTIEPLRNLQLTGHAHGSMLMK
jgi:hypothetical protein